MLLSRSFSEMHTEHQQGAVATAGGSLLSIPRNDGSAELLFDILEASMHRYVIMLPFTCVNTCSALSGVNTDLNLLPPLFDTVEKENNFSDSLNCPIVT